MTVASNLLVVTQLDHFVLATIVAESGVFHFFY
jgi:hypothetical protein